MADTVQQAVSGAGEWVPLAEAAPLLGLAMDTVRRKLRRGELQSRKVPTDRGFKYEVLIEQQPRQDIQAEPMPIPSLELSRFWQVVEQLQQENSELIAQNAVLLGEQQRISVERIELAQRNSAIEGERVELYGRLGYMQAQLQQAQQQLLETQEELKQLKAPPPEPEDVALAAPPPPSEPENTKPWWKFW